MTSRFRVPILVLAALLAGVSPVFGQSVLQVSAVSGGQTLNIPPEGTLPLTAVDISQPVPASVTIKYTGTATAIINSISISGTAEIKLVASPTLPLTLKPGDTTTINVQYVPASGNAVIAHVAIGFTESGQASSFQFALMGTSPRLAISYFFAPNGSPADPVNGITFPPTNVGSSSQAVVTVLNLGSAPGLLQSVTVSGAAFQASGFSGATTLQAGQQATFTVTFSPTATGGSLGLLTVTTPGFTATFPLSGTGTSGSLTVSYVLANGNTLPLVSGSVINFPSVDIGATSTATVTILNQGTGPATVTGVNVAGAGFLLTALPLLPATLPAGQSLRFGIVFAPTQAGSASGTFRIDLGGSTISGTLVGSTNASGFAVSYTAPNGNAQPITSGSAITFPNADVNGTSTITVNITNQGAGAGTVTGISVSGAGFQLTGAPLLPATVPAGQTLRFGIVFAPTSAGTFNGSFTITLGGTTIFGTLTGSTNVPNFSASYTIGNGSANPLTTGTSIAFPSVDVNGTSTATIIIQNQGAGTGTINGISVTGAGFQVSGVPVLPVTIPTNVGLRFGIVFAPTQIGTFNGTFRFDLSGGASISGTLTGTTAPSNISLAYVDPTTNNTIPLPSDSTLQFPKTLSGAVSNIAVIVANAGAGTGVVNSITLGANPAAAFQLVSLPSLPISVPPSKQFPFGVRFSPQTQGSFTATLSVNINGQVQTINLAAESTGPQYTYTVTSGAGTTPLPVDGTLAIPDTNVSQSTSVTVSIANNGTGDGVISGVAVSGQGFSISGLPGAQFIIHAKGSQDFTVTFAPTQAGAFKGKLTIGSDSFTITGTGIGPNLVYSYTNAAGTNVVTVGGAVIFAPTAVGTTGSVTFSIKNTGTSAATISSINLAAASTIFTLQQLPGLPLSLSPDATITLVVNFIPNNTGTATATLMVNSSSFILSGTGTPPLALPSYQFQGSSGTQPPAQQRSIGLSLSSPYPLPLRGVLTLSFTSSVFVDDPAIQFATAGRTLSFTIPANSTQALFAGGLTSVPLQTGTTAGNIVITPSFALQSGLDVTPSSPDVLTLTIPRAVPQLTSGNVTAESLSGFSLILSGYSTTRSLGKLDIDITPKSGATFSTTHLTIDLSSPSTAWFQSNASLGFGGSFSIAIPFTLQNGSSTATADLVHLLQSLSITVTNDVGTSTALSVAIP